MSAIRYKSGTEKIGDVNIGTSMFIKFSARCTFMITKWGWILDT